MDRLAAPTGQDIGMTARTALAALDLPANAVDDLAAYTASYKNKWGPHFKISRKERTNYYNAIVIAMAALAPLITGNQSSMWRLMSGELYAAARDGGSPEPQAIQDAAEALQSSLEILCSPAAQLLDATKKKRGSFEVKARRILAYVVADVLTQHGVAVQEPKRGQDTIYIRTLRVIFCVVLKEIDNTKPRNGLMSAAISGYKLFRDRVRGVQS